MRPRAARVHCGSKDTLNRLFTPAARLLLCGAAALFWELLLIRWLGSCIRVVAYYTNFVLLSAFLGLGAGALLVGRKTSIRGWVIPALALIVVLGPTLGSFEHHNPGNGEAVWRGTPAGVLSEFTSEIELPFWVPLLLVYLLNTAVFAAFGQWIGELFRGFPPLRAYTIEIGGSLVGIAAFALVSYAYLPPPAWFLLGFLLVLAIGEFETRQRAIHALIALGATAAVVPFSGDYIWSRYYKIELSEISSIADIHRKEQVHFDPPVGVFLSVNNDYHQMILDLRPRTEEHAFLRSWRWLYDYPYANVEPGIPQGPVLVVGAGTGNDVSAALRAGSARIDAIEIDPRIVEIGREHHPERPYDHPAVHVTVNDARSYLARTNQRYARIVFGFLDSHTLMSSFSSLRLDNFVYTREAMERAKEVLLPGGQVHLTFATQDQWLAERLVALLDDVFDYETRIAFESGQPYSNGLIFVNGRAPESGAPPKRAGRSVEAVIPTDDWPFLYMRDRVLPPHYVYFMVGVVVLGCASLGLLPSGQRRIRLPYFFLGAGFFLIETSNVVALSLLYGSTWIVNVSVFSGILLLILLGNATCMVIARPHFPLLFGILGASVLLSWLTPPALLLGIESVPLQAVAAITIFLGPVYVASVIFGSLIRQEHELYAAYGSNLLGAVIGGACEYLAIVTGMKFLLLITLGLYATAGLLVGRGGNPGAAPATG